MSASAPSQTVFSLGYDFHFANGDNGNVFAITNYKDNSRNQSFTYDSLNRLTSAQNAGTNCSAGTVNGKSEYWGNSYTYDAWGNLTDKTKTKCNAEDIHFTVDAHNWLHVLAGADYAYDAAGNMTYNANGAQSYSYDQENRITGAAGYTYAYDGDGNRVEKSNGGTGTLYWYMSPGIVAESDLSGNLTSEYVFFDGERVARKDFPGLAVSYYFSDHLKTTDIVTDASGNIKNESDFYPWGGELEFLANDSNHYKFTGKERDSETGLDYFGARYYSNGLGRFITPDWAAKATAVPYAEFADPQSLNLYSYVRNVPTTRMDADGHEDDGKSVWQSVKEAVWNFFTSGPSNVPSPAPKPACPLPTSDNKQNNAKQNNTSQSSNAQEQGRDAQGKFLPKKGGESAPGSAAEKKGLDSVGAVKNKSEILNGTKRDGTIPETGQHVEVKSGESVNDTNQLRKMGQAAMDKTGQPLKVVTTNPNVDVSKPALNNKNLEFDHKPQK